MRVVYLALAALLFATPCAAGDYKFTPKAGPKQEVEYDRGIGTTWSDAPYSEVKLTQSGEFASKRVTYILRVWKFTGQKLDMDLSNVSVRYGSEPLHVYNADELKKIIRGRAAWASFASSLLTGARAGLATNASSIRTSGRIGNTYYSSKSTIYTPDYEAQADAYADGRETQDRISDQRDAIVDGIDSLLLQRTTLKEDDDEYVWKIVSDRPKKLNGSLLTVLVTVGAEIHEFNFEVTEE